MRKMKRKSLANILLVVGLCLAVGCSGIAYLFHTSVGKSVVREISYETEYGSLAGVVYKPQLAYPAAALAANSTAGVVLAHDYGGSREKMSMAAIELTKRGFTVFSIDLYGHGHSTLKSTFKGNASALAGFNAGGVWDAVKYMRNLTYVDNARISIAVHGNPEINLASKALELDNAQWDESGTRYIAGVLFIGNEPTDNGESLLRNRDAGILLAKNDEYKNNKNYLSSDSARSFVNTYQNPDMQVKAGEAVKNGLEKLKTPGYTRAELGIWKDEINSADIPASGASLTATQATLDKVATAIAEKDKYSYMSSITTYQWTRIAANGTRTTITAAQGGTSAAYTIQNADKADGVKLEIVITVKYMSGTAATSFRSVYLANVSHSRLASSFSSAKAVINFFGLAEQSRQSAYLGTEANSEVGQTWWLKEAATGGALIGFFLFVLGAAFALYGVVTRKKSVTAAAGANEADSTVEVETDSAVSETAADSPEAVQDDEIETEKPFTPDAPKSKAGRLIYWLSFGLTIVLSGIFFWLAFQAGGGAVSANFNRFFNQPVNNGILTALIVTGVIGLGLFVLSAFLNKKFNDGPDLKTSLLNGIPVKASNIVRSLLVAAGVVLAGFSLAGFMQWMFQVDFRFWLWSVNTFELRVFGSILKYLLFFAVYFVIQSYVINNGVAAKRKEIWNYLLAIAASAGGLILVGILYGFGTLGGANLFGQSLLAIVNIMMIPLLALSAVVSRLAYNKSGTIWLGAILNTVLITALLCAGTVTLY